MVLVLVDLQKRFFIEPHPTAERSRDLHLPQIINLLTLFRNAGRPVVFVLHDGPARGTAIPEGETDPLDGISILPGEVVVRKKHMNGFNGTDLAERIRETGADTVLICGMYAEHCAMATYWGAWDCGLSPFMAKGALIAFREESLESVYDLCRTYDEEEVRENPSSMI